MSQSEAGLYGCLKRHKKGLLFGLGATALVGCTGMAASRFTKNQVPVPKTGHQTRVADKEEVQPHWSFTQSVNAGLSPQSFMETMETGKFCKESPIVCNKIQIL